MSGGPLTIAGDRDPWERQPGESLRMYSRFRAFLELGRARTLKQVAETLQVLGDEVGYRSLQQYSYRWRWTERAEAHDRDQDRLDRERLLARRREMTERHLKLSTALMAKAVERLRQLPAADLTALDVVRFVRTAVAIEQAALGEPERTVAVTGPAGGPLVVEDFARYTPQERQDRLRALLAELGRRVGGSGADEDDD